MDESLLRFNKTSSLVFIDLETFCLCLSFCHNLPWQIGMIKVKGDVIEDNYMKYIRWKTNLKISKKAAEITHFNQTVFDKEAIPPEEVYRTMKEWLNQATYIIGHNILGFDVYLIKEWYLLNGDDPEPLFNKIIDTNCLAKALKLNLPPPANGQSWLEYQYPILHHKQKGLKTNLRVTGEEFGIEHDYEHLHDALVDLELNVKVWQKLKYSLSI